MTNDGKFLTHSLLSCDYAIEDIANQLWHSLYLNPDLTFGSFQVVLQWLNC